MRTIFYLIVEKFELNPKNYEMNQPVACSHTLLRKCWLEEAVPFLLVLVFVANLAICISVWFCGKVVDGRVVLTMYKQILFSIKKSILYYDRRSGTAACMAKAMFEIWVTNFICSINHPQLVYLYFSSAFTEHLVYVSLVVADSTIFFCLSVICLFMLNFISSRLYGLLHDGSWVEHLSLRNGFDSWDNDDDQWMLDLISLWLCK